jgi:hypothetical protein
MALSAIAVGIVLALQACAPFIDLSKGRFGLVIKFPHEILGQASFVEALKKVQHQGVSYEFHLVTDKGQHSDYEYGPKVTLKTDNVTVTELAQSLRKDGLTPIGSSLTHHIYSADAADIGIILGQIKPSE